ncbi:MAG: hypothetical protein Q7U91_15875, partial [Sideroxyarcus sp.]|nr:hypothetical protein [Sideroxyarcus sp.]
IEFTLKIINVAFNTLSVQRTRDAYDARLAALNPPASAATSLSMVPITPGDEAASLKAEAMSLRAEAMSLKAEAVSLRADVMALKVDSGYQSPSDGVLDKTLSFLSPFKRVLTVLGSLVAMGLVVQVIFLLLMNRQAAQVVDGNAHSQDKVILQDYYQQTGVRVNSIAEMELMEAANRREEQAQRAEKEQERAKQEQEREYERFVRESRRDGEKISADLRRAEERARDEEERKQRQLMEEARWKEEQESLRIEREKERWRRVLNN